MIPGAGVVTCPSSRVTLAACVAGAGHYKGPLIGSQLQNALIGAARILHAEDIVDFKMIGNSFLEARLVNAVLGLVRHGLRGHFKERWLVHVVPEAGNTFVDKVCVECAPPVAAGFLSEIWEDRRSRPYDAGIDRAVRVMHKVVAGDA